MHSLIFTLVLLFAAWVPTTSHAQVTAPSAAFDAFMWQTTGGGQQTISYSANGTPLISPSSAVVSADGGLPKVVQSGSIANPSGNRVPVSLLSRIPAAKIANMVMGGIGGALVLQAGVALYDLAKEFDFTLMKPVGGPVTATKTVISPDQYNVICQAGNIIGGLSSLTATCKSAAETYWRTRGYPSCTYAATYTTSAISLGYGGAACGGYPSYGVGFVSAGSASQQAANLQELSDAIASKSGWPSTSKVSQALVDAVAITGTKIQPDVGTVTGPATSVGKVTTTNNTTNNTTKTETVTHHHTYEGAKVTTNNVTTTVVINNADGSVVSSETKTDPAPVQENVPFCGLPGYPDCSVKVNEAGTKADLSDSVYQPKIDTVKTAQDTARETISGTADKSFFSGWTIFFAAPALAACTPFVLPRDMGSIDPCPVVDGVRYVMGLIWAMTGLLFSLRMIKQVV